MEFRRHLKERLSQLRENEALNVTGTSSDGKGIRKVEFNPQTARSLVSVPYHKQIVFNLNKGQRGLDNFLRLEGYDKNKIEKVHQRLRGSKVSSPRRDREVNPPPGSRVLYNPSVLYFYGTINPTRQWDIQGYLFVRGNDNQFYNVFYYDNGWFQNFKYQGINVPDQSQNDFMVLDQDPIHISYHKSKQVWGGSGVSYASVDISLNVDLLGDGRLTSLRANGLTVDGGDILDYSISGGKWFCKQLEGSLPDRIFYGNGVADEVKKYCARRAIY